MKYIFTLKTIVTWLILIVNLLCLSTVFADTSFSPQQEIETSVKKLAINEWGKTAIIKNSMTYTDFNGLPFATGFYFEAQDDKPLGTIVMSNLSDTPPLIEIVYGYSLHDKVINALKIQNIHASDIKIRYYPFVPPIVEYKDENLADYFFINGEAVSYNDFALDSVGNMKKKYPKKAKPSEKMKAASLIFHKELSVNEINTKGDWVGCTPAAATNYFGYLDDIYKDTDYYHTTFLASGNSNTATKTDINVLLKESASALKTTPFTIDKNLDGSLNCSYWRGGSTSVTNICNGLETVARNHGYALNCRKILRPSFKTVTDYLIKGSPVLLGGLPKTARYGEHRILAIGFDRILYNTIYIHDSWPGSPCDKTGATNEFKKLNWSWYESFATTNAFVLKSPYIKIANNGNELPDNAVLGSGSKDWACTKDTRTGLIWEIKTRDGGLHDWGKSYSNYQGSFNPSDNPRHGLDVTEFVNQVNANGFCGANDWRMPSITELQGLVDKDIPAPFINTAFFPNVQSYFLWSSTLSGKVEDTVFFKMIYSYYMRFQDGQFYEDGNSYMPVQLVRPSK